jgi:protein O-GlcNAcase/histone acetyltransferase
MNTPFFAGVVEGFYGRPWSTAQRHRLFGWMQQWGLSTYFYTPKDDLKHRTRWRLRYTAKEAAGLGSLIGDARRHGVDFIYGIGPGLDVEHSSPRDVRVLQRKAEQILDLGGRHFALLFDDIAPKLSAADTAKFSSIAAAQAWFTNQFYEWLKQRVPGARLFFCPTPYCGRMCEPSVRESTYLRDLGALLDPGIDVFWTGPEIISETISVASIRELSRLLRRPPVIWDNLHANDYDLRRIYLGPYAGRADALKSVTRGVVTNPNCEFELNFIPLHTLAHFAHAKTYSPAAAWTQAIAAWTPEFATPAPTRINETDVRLLSDSFHLPYATGPLSRRWRADFHTLLTTPPAQWGSTETRFRAHGQALQRLFDQLTALTHRDLLYSLYRHLWELKEEVILLHRYLDWLKTNPAPDAACFSAEHRAGTYRGGLVAELQRQVPMRRDGGFGRPT